MYINIIILLILIYFFAYIATLSKDRLFILCLSFIADFNNKASGNILLIIVLILSGAILIILILLALYVIKRTLCVAKKNSVEEPKQQPIYDEIKPYHEEIQVEGNAAYGHMIHARKKCIST